MKKFYLFLGITIAVLGVQSAFSKGSKDSHSDVPRVSPDQVFEQLKDGNQRFVSGKENDSKIGTDRRLELTHGQHPSAIILSCSDSRVPPEHVFGKGLGDLFVIRVAGHVLGNATVASIEYAVEHLGSSLIVVMGHESCGAVKAALTTPITQSVGSKDLDALVSSIRPSLTKGNRSLASFDATDKKLTEPVKANINGVADQLVKRSPIIRKAVESGKVQIKRALYQLDSGKVDFWN